MCTPHGVLFATRADFYLLGTKLCSSAFFSFKLLIADGPWNRSGIVADYNFEGWNRSSERYRITAAVHI